MADFNEEHKKEMGAYFPEGIHKVNIVDVQGGSNDNDKEFIEFTVEGENGEEGTARMWFTTDKAIGYTFSNIRGLFTHNAKKGKEEEAKEMVNATANSDELVALCKKVLVGKEAWYQVEQSDYTYTNQAGEQKHGYNRNITAYEPKPKKQTIDDIMPGNTKLDSSEIPEGL